MTNTNVDNIVSIAMTSAKRVVKRVDLTKLAKEYSGPPEASRSQRIAAALDYCAKHAPYIPIPANILTMMVYGYQHKPRLGTKEVDIVWTGISGARAILHKMYGRACWTEKGEGVRAAVNDDDGAEHGLTRASKRIVSAEKSLREVRSTIDVSKVKNEKIRKWIKSSVDQALKSLGADDLMNRLLVEKTEDK